MRFVLAGLLAVALSACANMETPVAKPEWTLLIHGGAGVMRRAEMTPEMDAAYRAGLNDALEAGSKVLAGGGQALDAVEAAVRVLEDNPNFNAGRGAVLTREGVAELDASIMDGRDRRAGAVAQVRTVRNPIRAARHVMDNTGRVMFAGPDVDEMAKEAGLEIVPPEYFITPRRQEALKRAMAGSFVRSSYVDGGHERQAARTCRRQPDHRRGHVCRQRFVRGFGDGRWRVFHQGKCGADDLRARGDAGHECGAGGAGDAGRGEGAGRHGRRDRAEP
jgi:Asparaginase